MEENLEESSNMVHDDGQNRKGKVPEGMKIVGYNILILIAYTILTKLSNDVGGLIIDAFLIGLHVIICIIMAIVKRSGTWLLGGILVLIIGFSTCISFGDMKI